MTSVKDIAIDANLLSKKLAFEKEAVAEERTSVEQGAEGFLVFGILLSLKHERRR